MVRKKWLSPYYNTYWCYIHQTCTNCSSWHDLLIPRGGLCPWPTFHASVTKTQKGYSGAPVMVPITIMSSFLLEDMHVLSLLWPFRGSFKFMREYLHNQFSFSTIPWDIFIQFWKFLVKHLSDYQLLNTSSSLSSMSSRSVSRKELRAWLAEIKNSIHPQYLECFDYLSVDMTTIILHFLTSWIWIWFRGDHSLWIPRVDINFWERGFAWPTSGKFYPSIFKFRWSNIMSYNWVLILTSRIEVLHVRKG